MAPSAANRQPYKIFVLHTAGREQDLRSIYNSDWFVQPPYVICLCISDQSAWKRQSDGMSFAMADAAIAFDHLVLTATSLGLGTCWISAFNIEATRWLLGLTEDLSPLFFTPLGYPGSQSRPPKRRRLLDDLVVVL
jgi:nitroreductase